MHFKRLGHLHITLCGLLMRELYIYLFWLALNNMQFCARIADVMMMMEMSSEINRYRVRDANGLMKRDVFAFS